MLGRHGGHFAAKFRVGFAAGGFVARNQNGRDIEIACQAGGDADFSDLLAVQTHFSHGVAVEGMAQEAHA
ncbi:hypothetical protein SDC9_200904 [bioreactor metagenome]|uniref:Uncharacterized protein n=1 Tax=bioreactor metagenome TaxID=1076179 RepID=A0A645IQK6_9ZZZZ